MAGRLVLLLASWAVAGSAMAGLIAPPDQPPPFGAAEAPADAEGGRVLDRALQGDLAAGGRRLDLLLELQRQSAAASPAADPVRRTTAAGAAPSAAASAPRAEPVALPATLALLREALRSDQAEGVLGSVRAAVGAEPAVRRREADPETGGGAMDGTDAVRGAGDASADHPRAIAWLLALPQTVGLVFREYLGWLLGGLLLVGLLAVVVRLVDRRI